MLMGSRDGGFPSTFTRGFGRLSSRWTPLSDMGREFAGYRINESYPVGGEICYGYRGHRQFAFVKNDVERW